MHSNLNQNLNAEISLSLDNEEFASDVLVRMAAPEEFDKQGIPWNYFLSKISFETVKDENGLLIIKLSSSEALTEPFLDLLVEVSSLSGKQRKEFTLLIDPASDYSAVQTNSIFESNTETVPEVPPTSFRKPHHKYHSKRTTNQIETSNLKSSENTAASEDQSRPKVQDSFEPKKSKHRVVKRLELSAPISQNSTGSITSNETTVTTEEASKTLVLQARVESLEQQLESMQKLLTLKDQQLAALQTINNTNQPPIAANEIDQAKVLAPQAEAVPPSVTEEKVQPQTPEKIEHPAAALEIQKPLPAPVAQIAAVPEKPSSFFDNYYVTVAGLGVTVLSVLGGLFWRQRQSEANKDKAFFSEDKTPELPENEVTISVPVIDTIYDLDTISDDSFIDDLTSNQFEGFDPSQTNTDPLSEADVYIAYGRYQQAEEVIKLALVAETENDDFKLKLFEIYSISENHIAFSNYAQQLLANGKQVDTAFWDKVHEMAKEIDSNFLDIHTETTLPIEDYSLENNSSSEYPTSVANKDVNLTNYAMDREFKVNDSVAQSELESNDTHFVLKLDSEHTLDFEHTINFDTDLEKNENINSSESNKEANTLQFESIEFDFSDFALPGEVDKNNTPAESDEFNFDFNNIQPHLIEEKTKTINGLATENSTNHEAIDEIETTSQFDFNFDFDFELPFDSLIEEDSTMSVADITDRDELETKIDLAKAYLEMGDEKASHLIIEDVLHNGSIQQQETAKAILDQLKVSKAAN